MNATPPDTGHMQTSQDSRYLLLVGGMLVLIIVLLGVLWMRERNARIAAEDRLARLRIQQQPGQMGQALQQMILRRQMEVVGAIRREDLPRERGVLDGRPVTVIHLGASGGRRLGFEPGDVVAISSEPASAPSSEPSP